MISLAVHYSVRLNLVVVQARGISQIINCQGRRSRLGRKITNSSSNSRNAKKDKSFSG